MIALRGVVVSGLGQGAFFMSRPWVRETVRRLLGFVPYPGTLNVQLDAGSVTAWRAARGDAGITLPPAPGESCGGRLFPVLVGPGIEAAIVVPDATRHADDLLELIARDHLRGRLGLRDGDRIEARLGRAARPAPPPTPPRASSR